jgi:hypothetical protein
LPSLLCAAEADESPTAGFRGTETGADAVVGVHIDVACKFSLEIGICAVFA